MTDKELKTLDDVNNFKVDEGRDLFSATHEEIEIGATTDIYFIRTKEILEKMNLEGTEIVAEIFAGGAGIVAGIDEALNLLKKKDVKVWALEEGSQVERKDVVMRIEGAYSDFGIFETAILGILASSSGWATAARECKQACGEIPMLCFGARHVHPAIAPVMERAALVGGADGASCILGAKLFGKKPSGTVPHALILTVGDTLEVAKAYDEFMPDDAARIILVDTFQDEAVEAVRLADALKENLDGIRLDTASERGGVTPGLVKEVRARLDQAGHNHVNIFVSGGLTPERIIELKSLGVNGFGVGSYISGAKAIDMTMDIKEINGKPIAKRGRIPGKTDSPNLKRVL
ncbi:nicotinate phosphoribosyltransferase [Orenia metallireducens]|jgi:nicotinate phosphoribosyltransferase|uniref:Nicotinate phosphoribosyltransferase n=1 Tax=Orenia metallireducens TaxID=1413210 RepID=A0A285H553_9FIRM|nr:nicotinate phosphoribosyltransferase [Orenia metallireducens]PRX28623.1 nicotinate phosphoribosyltransferase [Orenia metallireducens]SNY30855.1 nicotinate phosphoribosyltransferase [Orenia metallireducens]